MNEVIFRNVILYHTTMNEVIFRNVILYHTRMCQSIRSKLKRMLRQLPLPEISIERYILNYIGTPTFKFYKHIRLINMDNI